MNWGARRPETLVPRTPDSLRVCTLGICASIDCYLARPQPGDGNVRARRDGASIVSVFFCCRLNTNVQFVRARSIAPRFNYVSARQIGRLGETHTSVAYISHAPPHKDINTLLTIFCSSISRSRTVTGPSSVPGMEWNGRGFTYSAHTHTCSACNTFTYSSASGIYIQVSSVSSVQPTRAQCACLHINPIVP